MQLDDESLARILDRMPQEEPPADLRASIMGSVSSLAEGSRSSGTPRFGSRSGVYAIWAMAAALVVGFYVFSTVRDRHNAAATMAAAPVSIAQSGDLVTVHVATPGSISVRWDARAAALVAISGGADASSSPDQTTFSIGSTSARAAVTFRVRPEARSLALSVSADGKPIYSGRVAVN